VNAYGDIFVSGRQSVGGTDFNYVTLKLSGSTGATLCGPLEAEGVGPQPGNLELFGNIRE
jgi:hypothetical protein